MSEFQGTSLPSRAVGENFSRPYTENNLTLIDFKELQKKVGKSRSTVYRWIELDLLPKPIKGNQRTQNMWNLADVDYCLAKKFS